MHWFLLGSASPVSAWVSDDHLMSVWNHHLVFSNRPMIHFVGWTSDNLFTPSQERGTATEPPPRSTFSGNVTQWEIYDAYQEDFEKQVNNFHNFILRLRLRDNIIKWVRCAAVRLCVIISQKRPHQKYQTDSMQIWCEASRQWGLVSFRSPSGFAFSSAAVGKNNPQIGHFIQRFSCQKLRAERTVINMGAFEASL